MKNNQYILKFALLTIAACMAASCVDSLRPEDASSDNVKLSAYMGYVPTKGTATDDSGIRDTGYEDTLHISLVRIDENVVGTTYPKFQMATECLEGVLGEPDASYKRDIEFMTAQFFRNSTDRISYASWYPRVSASNFSSTSEKTTVSFNIDGATDILYGTVAKGSKNEGFNDIVFNHALCQFNIYAYKMSSDDTVGDADGQEVVDFDWGAISSIVVNGFQTKCVMTLPRDEEGTTYEFSIPNDAANKVGLELSTPSNGIYWNPGDEISVGYEDRNLVSSFLGAPPTDGYISFAVNTTTQTAYQKISIARDFQRGCAYDIILRFTCHGIVNAEISAGEWHHVEPLGGEKITQDVEADMYYDLSSYRTANSYIIPSGNYGYSFTGTVKGNSKELIDPEPTYLDILWSDNDSLWMASKPESENYVRLSSHTLSKNRVMLKVGDIRDNTSKTLKHRGNVVVAAYKDPTKKEILWSWHLWFDENIHPVGFNNGYLALNLNLGAVEEGGEGLYYQWGRKDPFIPGKFKVRSYAVGIDSTIMNPNVFYSSGDNWYTGTADQMKGFWGWTADNKDVTKSVYDPCPAGYQVADYRFWGTSNIGRFEMQNGYSAGNKATVEIANQEFIFPLSQGYLDASGAKNTTKQYFCWSSSYSGANPYAMLYSASKTTPVVVESHKNYAGSVRCISKSKSVVTDLSSPQTANCYIISRDGYYKFKADVAGNGLSTLITDKQNEWNMDGSLWGDHTKIDTEFNPDKVDYLWYQPALDTTIPDTIITDSLCLKILNGGVPDANGYVDLEVKGWKKGNYVLAAYKGSTIKWSWHFWLTDEPSDMSSPYYDLMDRNLGATSVGSSTSGLESFGFYYQWGRKDPFIGPSSTTVSSSNTSLASSGWFLYSNGSWSGKQSTIPTAISGPVSLKTAVENPHKFITSSTKQGTNPSGTDGVSVYHWLNYITWTYKHIAMWGYAVEDKTWGNKPSKTIYDPCPPGYTVPHHWVFWNVPGQGLSGGSSTSYDFSLSGKGYTWSQCSGLWLPMAGKRNYANGAAINVGTDGHYFYSVPGADQGRSLQIGSSFSGLYSNTPDNHDQPSYGFTIRCLKQ